MYKKILVAIDLYAECELVVEKAAELQKLTCAELDIIYSSEPPITGYGMVSGLDHFYSELSIKEELYPKMRALESQFNLPEGKIHIVFGGRPADEIIERAEKIAADLVLLGSHGRHGLSMLLGSTANAVLHRAKVDVLAVRVGK